MSTLERRVQVLFDPVEYDQLEALAQRERRSVGAVIRESVRRTLATPTATRQAALSRLLSRADTDPGEPVGDWSVVKAGFERDDLQRIQ
ncbi:MAG: hypothetical protein LBV06_01000 [Propionibacteriaceae bacterium]|jgi:hypothetical protein|nr:hypothetical protein [Propionibacteriaceae bacterium]